MGGWWAGNPAERGSFVRSASCTVTGCEISAPSKPRFPSGRCPIFRAVSASMPKVTKSDNPRPSVSTTPIAAYRASASSAAVSQMRSSVECSSRPVPTERMASSSCGTRAVSSVERPCRLRVAWVAASSGSGVPGGDSGGSCDSCADMPLSLVSPFYRGKLARTPSAARSRSSSFCNGPSAAASSA